MAKSGLGAWCIVDNSPQGVLRVPVQPSALRLSLPPSLSLASSSYLASPSFHSINVISPFQKIKERASEVTGQCFSERERDRDRDKLRRQRVKRKSEIVRGRGE